MTGTPAVFRKLPHVMTSSPAGPTAPEGKPSAIVVGAGMAGLSAAFYLAERGYAVTVYEKEKEAGGNLGATIRHGSQGKMAGMDNVFEVYPHMFGDWYDNFWELMDALGLGKRNSKIWREMNEFKFLHKPQTPAGRRRPSYQTLRNNGSLQSLWSNLFSGIIPVPDMILAGYAALGLFAEDFKDTDDLNVATLNDFLNTRFYGSKYVTQFYQMIILYIWSMEPDESSVYACQRFFQYQFRRPTPSAWILKSGDAYTSIIRPLVTYLQSKWNVTFRFDSPVVAASLNSAKDKVEQLLVIRNYSQEQRYKLIPKKPSKASAAVYVFAVPPETLAALVQTPIPVDFPASGQGADRQISLSSNRYGIITDIILDPLPAAGAGSAAMEQDLAPGEPLPDDLTTVETSARRPDPSPRRQLGLRSAIVDAIPELATTKTLSSEPIPVLYVGFKKGAEINRLIPEHCYVGLTDSKYALTFVEVTQEFKSANATNALADPVDSIVALAASDYGELPIYNLPPLREDQEEPASQSASVERQRLEDKTRDLLFQEAKTYLPFTEADIAWSFFRTNSNHRLFLNDVESARNPVKPVYRREANAMPIIENLAFAGDYCSQDVVMSTVEAAVESGFQAGVELVNNHSRQPDHKGLRLQSHRAYPQPLVASLKLMLLPSMVLVKGWSDFNQCMEDTRYLISDPRRFQQDVLSQWLTFWPRQASTSFGATQDALYTMSSLATESLLTSSKIFWSFFNRR
ncbi:MAG: oleate hydratase [Cyanobacteriota bacterium]